MRIPDFTYLTVQSFRTRKSRMFFTILSVSVAIATILTLVSLGYGLQQNLREQITNAESLLTLEVTPLESGVVSLNDAALKKIADIPSVERISPRATFAGLLTYNDVAAKVDVHVVDSYYYGLDAQKKVAGTLPESDRSGDAVVSGTIPDLFSVSSPDLVGKSAGLIFNLPAPEGSSVSTIDVPMANPLTVVAVVGGGDAGAQLYISRQSLPKDVSITTYQVAKVQVSNEKELEVVRTQITSQGFNVSSVSDTLEEANKIFRALQIVLGVFGIVALVVAAIGLINTMTISLLERTSEIGIMRAIGAAPADIKRIFLGESTLIGFLGGMTGIVLGIVISETLNWAFNLLARAFQSEPSRLFAYPIWFIVFVVGLSTLVGFVGGIWPARRAAKMNPLEALRYK